jgi:hypothetical protein
MKTKLFRDVTPFGWVIVDVTEDVAVSIVRVVHENLRTRNGCTARATSAGQQPARLLHNTEILPTQLNIVELP